MSSFPGNKGGGVVHPLLPYDDSSEEETSQSALKKQCLSEPEGQHGYGSHLGSIEGVVDDTSMDVDEEDSETEPGKIIFEFEDENKYLSSSDEEDIFFKYVNAPDNRKVYYIQIKDEECERSRCINLLEKIGCDASHFVKCSKKMGPGFYAMLKEADVAKLDCDDEVSFVARGSSLFTDYV